MIKVPIEGLAPAIEKTLVLYNEKVAQGIKQEARKSMARLVRETKATAPKRRPKYAGSISSKTLNESRWSAVYVWYVKGSEYRLSHLLERGHALRNGGRVGGTHFIESALNPIMDDYEKSVREVIENG